MSGGLPELEGRTMTTVRRILHATDFSQASRPAFARALEWAKRGRAALLLVHVLPPVRPVLEDSYIPATMYRDVEAAADRRAEHELGALAARARKAGIRASVMVLHGAPFEQIVRAAQRQRAGLVVIGTHGRTGLSRFVMGSVAERVVTQAGCPVLTVPANASSRTVKAGR